MKYYPTYLAKSSNWLLPLKESVKKNTIKKCTLEKEIVNGFLKSVNKKNIQAKKICIGVFDFDSLSNKMSCLNKEMLSPV